MPKQNRVKTITGGPQGEDAKVVLLMPTYGENRAFKTVSSRFNASSEDTPEQTEAKETQADTYLKSFISNHVVEWNWADEEGTPLPMPRHEITVLDKLMNEELTFLSLALAGQEASQESDRKK
jgi:hypothetical protein